MNVVERLVLCATYIGVLLELDPKQTLIALVAGVFLTAVITLFE